MRPILNRKLSVRVAWLSAGLLLASFARANAAPQSSSSASTARPRAQESHPTISVETSSQLFAVLCALDASGFQADADTSGETSGRIQLRQRMLALHGPAIDALRSYYKEHALADSGATFSRFVSFALAVGPPPKFQFEIRRDELPPDALALAGFNEIMANFYREAKIGELWKAYQPDYERGVGLYRAPVSNLVFTVTNYLREILRPSSARHFSVYVEPLAGENTNFRNYGDHYEIVVPPSADLSMDDIRHAFLHFMLDPMAIRYRAQAARMAPLLEYAARAPLLPQAMHDDYPAFFDECLVRAVEIRLRHLAPADLASALDQDDRSGYVLVRPIYAGLAGFEKSEPAMGYYLPDLIKGINVVAEEKRLRTMKFADAAPANAPPAAKSQVHPADAVEEELAEGQRQIYARNGDAAATAFESVLASHPDDLRATYGLAVASALQGKPELAREYFAKVIAGAPKGSSNAGAQMDPANLSWSHIYLGRIYDVEGQRELAVAEYRAALAVAGAPESARAAAQHGVDTGYQPPSHNQPPGGKP